jgi:type II secretory pathway pseudopilin PulG
MVKRGRIARSSPIGSGARTGVILVDVIVATILLAVALAVLISITGRSTAAQARGQALAIAARLADEQLQLVLARGPDDYARRFPVLGSCDPPFSNYSYDLALTGGSSAEPTQASVTISWMVGSSPQSLTIQTLVSSRQSTTGAELDPDRRPPQTIIRTGEGPAE